MAKTDHEDLPVTHSIQSRIEQGHLTLQFVKAADQFCHQLVWQAENARHLLVSSIHQTDSDCSSPTFQEVVTEQQGSKLVVLAVGQSTRNHWSGSVIESASEDSNGDLLCEFACRVNQALTWYGSVYKVDAKCKIASVSENEVSFELAGQIFRVQTRENSTVVFDSGKSLLKIQPKSKPDSLPGTIAWSYSFGLD